MHAHPVLRRITRAVLVFAVGVVAIGLARQLPWYPYRVDYYVWSAALSAVAIGVGRRAPLGLLLGMAIVVGWPGWLFSVTEVRLIPLGIAGFLATSGGLRLIVALPLTAASAVSAMIPYWVWGQPSLDQLSAGLQTENLSIRALAFCIVIAAGLLGRASFAQRRDAEELRRRNLELERLREADRERIATEERTAIAREIHDVVAHHISAMVIRAQGAARIADTRPEELRNTVEWIASSGQEALTAMRNVVRVLRGSDGAGTTEAPMQLGPALDEVVGRVRGAGLTVVTDIDVPAGLTALQEFALLRVCQEALTNVLIHSDATTVHIALTSIADDVVLLVEDDGAIASGRPVAERRAGALGSGGAGIRGMQERSEAVGGRLVVGPVLHGWRIELVLPTTADHVERPRPLTDDNVERPRPLTERNHAG
jgi:signal transduction histidine kinase